MNRLLSRVGTLMFVTLFLLGCGGAPQPPAKPSASSDSKSSSPSVPAIISIAAASDLKFALNEVAKEFGQQHPELIVSTTFGSSGSLFAELSNKAPFDIFLSADASYPEKLIEQGAAEAGSDFHYAVGHIGIWIPNDSPLEIGQEGLEILKDASVKKIAIANPKHAPYGRAAVAALKHFNVYDQVEDRLVLGENIAQAAQFVESGAADVGIIAQSLALGSALRDKGKFRVLPSDSHPKLDQVGVRLNWAKDRAACDEFRTFLLSEPGQSILHRHGFDSP